MRLLLRWSEWLWRYARLDRNGSADAAYRLDLIDAGTKNSPARTSRRDTCRSRTVNWRAWIWQRVPGLASVKFMVSDRSGW